MRFSAVLVGCPFRHSDPELLKQKLQFYKVSPSGISQVGVIVLSVGVSDCPPEHFFPELMKPRKYVVFGGGARCNE